MADAHTLHARAFIDASGEGDLAELAGAATRYGNDGAVNLATLATRFGGIPKDVTVSPAELTAAVQAARAAGRGPFSKESSVSRACRCRATSSAISLPRTTIRATR